MKPEKAFRIRLVKILEILRQETDEDNPMPTNTLIKKLAEQGIECDRRTLYRDIQVLNDYGYEVLRTRAISNEYYIVSIFPNCAFCLTPYRQHHSLLRKRRKC